MSFRKITDDFSVAPQISTEEIKLAAEEGFKTIICNRPDGEEFSQPVTEDMADAAGDQDLTFVHQPVISGNMSFDDVDQFRKLLDEMPKPILAYCRSGTRCSTLWALAEAPTRDTDEIIDLCGKAGYDYAGLRPTLDSLKESK